MSKYFKLVLLIRFLGYLIFFSGILSLFFILGPLIQVEVNYRLDQLLGVKRTVPQIITSEGSTSSGFEDLKTVGETITPVSTDFGIVIEKINANAKVVANVNPGSEREYTSALRVGVAHAKGSGLPGEKGNIYLFSHSTDAPWNIVRYNAIFYLLRELESGDRVILFYQGKRFDYIVFDKIVVAPLDLSYLTNVYDQEVLTLQTCDPPGTLLRRLVVRARLSGG